MTFGEKLEQPGKLRALLLALCWTVTCILGTLAGNPFLSVGAAAVAVLYICSFFFDK
jgi:hypothetical protein